MLLMTFGLDMPRTTHLAASEWTLTPLLFPAPSPASSRPASLLSWLQVVLGLATGSTPKTLYQVR
jgi:hypothetical protein